jgi:DNA-binding beta-propeller fold protein YncE
MASTACPACDIGPFTRNHYFTGKLLVERDFTDEQRYYVDKLRHHNQRLHGWGVVCGLRVIEHSKAECQNRFVLVEPGTAIDCCGHEIIVREETTFDLTQTEAFKRIKEENDPNAPHTLQICIRYRECPTEDIPVLYDECGCDNSQCAPNRILESFDLDVILDPEVKPQHLHTPRFEWDNTINIAHAFRVALHEPTNRLFVMTTDGPGAIFELDTSNHTVLSTAALPAKGQSMAVSNDGTRLYVVTEAATNPGTSKRDLHVFDTANLSAANALVRTIALDNSVGSLVELAVSATDGRLFVLIGKPGIVRIFSSGINTSGGSPSPVETSGLAANSTSLLIGTDGTLAYIADAANKILIIDVATQTLKATVNVLPASAVIGAMAIVTGTSDMVAVADNVNKQIHLVAFNPDKLIGSSTALPHSPSALAVSPGGEWIYILEQDGNQSFVQALSAHKIQLAPAGQNVAPGPAFEVGGHSQQLVITEGGTRIYVPYLEDIAVAGDGSVAILEVEEAACDEILWRHLHGCPHCDEPNCVVLATIENFHLNDKLEDVEDPPTDPVADDTANISRINNRKGRKLLPSVEVVTELIECLMEHATGGGGAQGPIGPVGPQGPDGPAGLGIDAVTATIIPCDQVPHDPTITVINNKRTLELEIPRGCDAPAPDPVKLTHICGINWPHGGDFDQQELFIAFDQEVVNDDLNEQSVVVLQGRFDQERGVTCWCEVQPKAISGVHFPSLCKLSEPQRVTATRPANGVRFIPANRFQPEQRYRVLVKGDFIRTLADHKAVDADHLPEWLPTRPTGDGVEGGTFESWFTAKQTP